MPRPSRMPERRPLTPDEIAAATYVGSAEHKADRWWGGLPGAWTGPDGRARRAKKQQTTICRKVGERDRADATAWVREALATGQVRFLEGDKTYPKHIWL